MKIENVKGRIVTTSKGHRFIVLDTVDGYSHEVAAPLMEMYVSPILDLQSDTEALVEEVYDHCVRSIFRAGAEALTAKTLD